MATSTIGEGQQMTEPGLDEPVADVVEQRQEAIPDGDESEAELPRGVPLEADAADAAEQARSVELGEDEYR
jgi:hypothetical protein